MTRALREVGDSPVPRSARMAVIGGYTTNLLTSALGLAAARAGVQVEVYKSQYGQYRLEAVEEAARRDCNSRTGTYVPLPKNGQVVDLYHRHGFTHLSTDAATGATSWSLALSPATGGGEATSDDEDDV